MKKETSTHQLHPRNKHQGTYDFEVLTTVSPELKQFVSKNKFGNQSIDFSNPQGVKALNKALLIAQYQLEYWDFPDGFLCPPIPGRADYIHHLADLLLSTKRKFNFNKSIPKGEKITCLDIGTGANCIYPIIGNQEYQWHFIGSDIDNTSVNSAQTIVTNNKVLKDKIDIRPQNSSNHFFTGVILPNEFIDITLCNPPFHSSAEEALKGTQRKLHNLKPSESKGQKLNFGGKNNELWCEGGERSFITKMIKESEKFGTNCFWFSSLVSKEANLKSIYSTLNDSKATSVETINMGQGNKKSRFVAWTFLSPKQQKNWAEYRW